MAHPVVAMHLNMVRGRTCHAGKDAGMVKAGTGGQFGAADNGSLTTASAVWAAGGGLLAGLGGAWLLHGNRRSAQNR